MSGRLAAIGRFRWDFVVGDDPFVALRMALAVGVTGMLNAAGLADSLLLPVVVPVRLAASVRRAARGTRRRAG